MDKRICWADVDVNNRLYAKFICKHEFNGGERVVVIAEAEYERLKALERAARRLTECDDGFDEA